MAQLNTYFYLLWVHTFQLIFIAYFVPPRSYSALRHLFQSSRAKLSWSGSTNNNNYNIYLEPNGPTTLVET